VSDALWLPFAKLLDWRAMTMLDTSCNPHALAAAVASFDLGVARAELARIARMFTFNFTIEYIMDHVHHKAARPADLAHPFSGATVRASSACAWGGW
jgi:hypothetical protein